jgi:hypothetical protein
MIRIEYFSLNRTSICANSFWRTGARGWQTSLNTLTTPLRTEKTTT